MKTKRLILASNSPRRKDLLKANGFDFEIIASEYKEQGFSTDPIITAKTFAKGKAFDVFNSLKDKNSIVILSADTVVYCDGEILGKPVNEDEAYQMLSFLSGKTHTVATAFCIKSVSEEIIDFDLTKVTFNNLTDQNINDYIKSGLYKGKAGAYGIQDKEFNLVKEYEGSLNNVIGLPTEKVLPILDKLIK